VKTHKEKLLKKKILIRDCSNYRGLSKGYYRIAVKTHKENEKLISQLKDTIMDKYETLQSVN
jgi:threonine-phosphate decarboxylase